MLTFCSFINIVIFGHFTCWFPLQIHIIQVIGDTFQRYDGVGASLKNMFNLI